MTEAVDNPSPYHSTKSGSASWQLLQFQVVGEVHAFFNQSWNRRNGRSHSVRSNPGPRHWAGRYIRNVSSSFFCQLWFRLRTTRNVLLTSTPSVESLSFCLSESSSKFIWRMRAKFWLRIFRALCVDGVKMLTSCSRIMRAPRAFCIMPFGVGHLGNADFSVLSHDSACTMKLVIENCLWLSVID